MISPDIIDRYDLWLVFAPASKPESCGQPACGKVMPPWLRPNSNGIIQCSTVNAVGNAKSRLTAHYEFIKNTHDMALISVANSGKKEGVRDRAFAES